MGELPVTDHNSHGGYLEADNLAEKGGWLVLPEGAMDDLILGLSPLGLLVGEELLLTAGQHYYSSLGEVLMGQAIGQDILHDCLVVILKEVTGKRA